LEPNFSDIHCYYIYVILLHTKNLWNIQIFETSAAGSKLQEVKPISESSYGNPITISLNPEEKFQTITGFGGSFTEASAYLLNKLSKENRKKN
jgi:glucosylceramidase